jgi:hypothetical protein
MPERGTDVKHIDLDKEDQRFQQFVLSLELDADGFVLELHGKLVARVLPIVAGGASYDRDKLKAAILARRDESRRLNDDWSDADKDTWDSLPADKS